MKPSLKDLDLDKDQFTVIDERLRLNLDSLRLRFPVSGYLLRENSRWVATSEDFDLIKVLPGYIETKKNALEFLRHTFDQLRFGYLDGTEAKDLEISNKVADMFGLASKATIDEMQRKLDDIAGSVSRRDWD